MAALSYEASLFRGTRQLHFKNYIRVSRGLDTESALLRDFPTLDREELPRVVCEQDRLRILDLPDESQQAQNIAAVTALSATQLYSKAVNTPAQLTEPEIELLYNRLWLHVSDKERQTGTPVVLWLCTKRGALFEPMQADAMRHASEEYLKRDGNRQEAQKLQISAEALKHARPWVRQLHEELCAAPGTCWGYAMFIPPNTTTNISHLLCAFSPMMDRSIWDMCGGHILQRRFMPYDLPWPVELEDWYREDTRSLDLAALREEIGFEAARQQELEQEQRREEEDEQSLKAVVEQLRAHFCSVRNGAPAENVRDQSGLRSNLLRNVFLVFPRRLVHFMDDQGRPDWMWVWAVDPDFDSNDTSQPAGYQGYLRVRVPQLPNNFYELRRHRADQYPMDVLWKLAQRSLNQAFVSLDEQHFHEVAHTGDLEFGVDLKPPAVASQADE